LVDDSLGIMLDNKSSTKNKANESHFYNAALISEMKFCRIRLNSELKYSERT